MGERSRIAPDPAPLGSGEREERGRSGIRSAGGVARLAPHMRRMPPPEDQGDLMRLVRKSRHLVVSTWLPLQPTRAAKRPSSQIRTGFAQVVLRARAS